ncbi:HEAT repeat domain-containing protein [Dermatophilaceae bacterium Sec6.4]
MSSAAEVVSLANKLGDALDGSAVENVPGALPRLAEILAGETDAEVIAAAVGALGLGWDFQAAQIILDHVRIDHPDADVRLAVAQSLPCGVDVDGPVGAAVMEARITLTRDEETDVRDWACCGLGQINAFCLAARDALAARLDDADDDTRCEALLALAQAGDRRAATDLQRRLAFVDDEMICLLEIRAAAELADPQLHPLLWRLRDEWAGDDDELTKEFTTELACAISRRRPEQKVQGSTHAQS